MGNGCADQHPVYEINWYDAVKWCNALSEMEGLTPVYYVKDQGEGEVYRSGEHDLTKDAVRWEGDGYRLPTEAEWEFAARGGRESKGYLFSGSDDLNEVAWYRGNSSEAKCDLTGGEEIGGGTWPIGEKLPNELGIFDMSGNVREWCWDLHALYGRNAIENPKGPDESPFPERVAYRIQRGGCWLDLENICRVNFRLSEPPSSRVYIDTGLRVVGKAAAEKKLAVWGQGDN